MHSWGDDYFKARIELSSSGCWNWLLFKDKKGYGRLAYKGKSFSAHRASYLTYVGEIEPGLHVCHSCDNPSCVNPSHLWVGTNKQNHMDKINKGRAGSAREFKNANCKLSNEQVREIRKAYNTFCISHRTLGVLYGVSHRLIGRIISGQERKYA